jgi:hypothetical protein
VVIVTVLLDTPHNVADTVNVLALFAMVVPLPALSIEASALVLEMFQVTNASTLLFPVTPLKVASASNVRAVPPATLTLAPPFTVRVIVCTTGQTVTVWLELLTVPRDALTLVVAGKVGRFVRAVAWIVPGLVKIATFVLAEVQIDFPVTSPVVPSL